MTAPTPRYAFVEGALDRADALRDNADALRAYWPNARVVLIDGEGRTRADAAGAMDAVSGAALGSDPGDAIFLGMQGDQAWFART